MSYSYEYLLYTRTNVSFLLYLKGIIMKKFKSVKVIILCFIFLVILVSAFNKNNAATFIVNDAFFPNDQTVTGPGFFPFNNSQEVIDSFNQQGCPNPIFAFDGPDSLFGSTLEVGPAANDFETGSRTILVFDMSGNVSLDFLNAFPLANPNTMTNFDPSIGDILGLSLVPGAGFPISATFMVTTTFNCDNGTLSTSSSTSSSGSTSSSTSSSTSGSTVTSSSSSGSSFTNSELISDAINFEVTAKNLINIKHLIEGMDISFSVQDAITKLNDATSDLNKLQKRFENNDIMIGMSSVLTKLGDAINNDNEAIMVLEPFQNTTPDLTNGEFTKGLVKAKKLINEALRIKELIEAKFKKLEKNDKKDK